MDVALPRRASQRAMPWLAGLTLGLFVSRVVAETRLEAWSARSLFALVAVCAVAGMGLSLLVRPRVERLTPLFLLAVYVIWPQADFLLAGASVVATAVLFAVDQRRPLSHGADWLPDAVIWCAAVALYLLTLSPSVLPADSGEYQLVSAVLGIAHPPGYPLYTLLGKLFTLIPIGNPAYRVNLFAALVSATTLAWLCRLVRQSSGSRAAGMISALVLAAAPTFWAQSTTANIRSMTALFVVAQMHALYRYGETQERRWLYAFGVAFGLGVTHHGSLAFLAVPYLGYLLWLDPTLLRRWREWLGPLAASGACFAIWLYLPLRSAMGAPFDVAPIRTWQGFWDHVLARGFQGDMFAFLSADALRQRLPVLANILHIQFGWIMLGVVALGLLALARRRTKLALCVGGVALVNGFVAITYRAPQTVEYLMPAYMALAVLLGQGIALIATWAPKRLGGHWVGLTVAVGLAVLGGWRLVHHYPSFRQLASENETGVWARAMLSDAPPNAVVLANWHQATPLWYLQLVEGMRPDVDVEYVYPEGATPMGQVWARRIASHIDSRPVIVTNDHAAFDQLGYRFLPYHGGQQVLSGSLTERPAGMEPLDIVLDGRIRLLGYQIAADTLSAGEPAALRLAWQVMQPLEQDYSIFAHLVSAPGAPPLAQGDRRHLSSQYQVGEVLVDAFPLTLMPTVAAGDYTLLVGAYFTPAAGGWQRLRTADGQDAVAVAHVTVAPSDKAPATTQPLNIPFAGGARCVGVDYDTSVAGTVRAYLYWRTRSDNSARVQWFCEEQLLAEGVLSAGQGYGTVALDGPWPLDGRWSIRLIGDDGAPLPPLGPWHRAWSDRAALPAPQAGDRHLVLGGEMALVGAQWDNAGQVTLDFLSLQPLTRDYAVSVSMVGSDGSLIGQHDTTPALGAIPTLKWIRGTRVRDAHRIHTPASIEGAWIRLTVYDAFTLEPLAVADERLARQGQGTYVDLARIESAP